MKKRCCTCKKLKTLSHYSKDCWSPDGLSYRCKECQNAYHKKYYREHFSERQTYDKEYRRKNLKRLKAMDKAYRENNPEKERARYRLRKYGVTPEIYQEFFEAQGGVCAICHRPIKLSVDHDHDTDLIRGLLCKDCNLGIGCFGDDPNLVLNAVEYLVR